MVIVEEDEDGALVGRCRKDVIIATARLAVWVVVLVGKVNGMEWSKRGR